MLNLRAYPVYLGIKGASALFMTRGEQADYLGSFVGIPTGVLLGLLALNLPLVVGGALTIALGLTLFFAMPERNFRPSPRDGRSSIAHATATARGGVRLVRSKPVLLILLAAALFSGMSQEGFDRLNPKQFLDVVGLPTIGGFEPVVWFGVIGAGALGEASAGPVVGAIGNIFGVRQALTAALILSPTLLLYGRAIKRGGAEPGLKDATPEK
jgi:MFS transporter, DHA3 family, tetracycline resistance protein